MIEYTHQPESVMEDGLVRVPIFSATEAENIDPPTVKSFGEEWEKFEAFDGEEIERIGSEYFDIVDLSKWSDHRVLDAGCGSGRWARFLSSRVAFVEAVDPSRAVFSAARQHRDLPNVRFTCVTIDGLPFPDESFDAVVSLGVLHHVPDTRAALKSVVKKLRTGGTFVLYLYYAMDGTGVVFRTLFRAADLARQVISWLPGLVKRPLCDVIAVAVYLPLVIAARLATTVSPGIGSRLPLAFYRDKSFKVMRNDALDRFGTPLEKRFSKDQIRALLLDVGLGDIRFSDRPPYWHCSSVKVREGLPR
jgi:SAM-dependent methyltransferase